MYQFPENLRKAYESQPSAFVYDELIDGKVIPLLVSDGFCELVNMDRAHAMEWFREGQFERLHAAGLPFNVNIINAAAGPKRIAEHAAANAAVVNAAQPTLIFVSPLHVDPGTPLVGLIERGEFEECTLGQYLEEEIAFLEDLELDDCVFFGVHVSNPVPVNGWLPRDKEALLAALRAGMARIPQAELDAHPNKGTEGSLR